MKNNVIMRATRPIADYDAHSPMFKNRNFSEERRSRIFDDRPFMYGRLPKLVLVWMFSMQIWAGFYLYHKHHQAIWLQEKTKKAFRRTIPFVQAMEDVKYVALQERNYMILKAICDYKDPAYFKLFQKRWHKGNDDMFM